MPEIKLSKTIPNLWTPLQIVPDIALLFKLLDAIA
jgi:hypothetical protein